MRIAVSGGGGFLGSHLCEALLDRGDEVVCLDNWSTASPGNIEQLLDHPALQFTETDVSAMVDVPGPVDVVAHLASPASPPDYHRRPLETLAVGSRGTENMLHLAERTGARFVLASTSEVYGDPLIHPQREDYWGNVNPVGPRSVYDEAKRYAEAVSMAYRRSLGLDVGVVRIFNTYGPRLRPHDGRVVSSFITQALNGDPLTIYGDGRQTRSFCYVDDLIRGIVAMIDCDEPGPVNLGNPIEHTVRELAELVLRITGSSSPVEYHPLPSDDPTRRQPVITRARERLGWSPKISIEEGLRRTVDWFRSRPEDVMTADGRNSLREGDSRLGPLPNDKKKGGAMRAFRVPRLAVVGTGYVGTVVAACFARLGYQVVGIENDPAKLTQLQTGQIPFHEPGLEKLLNSCLRGGRLRFTADYEDGVAHSEVVFLCVGTPSLPDGSVDLSAMKSAAQSVATAIRHPVIVVTKSTIPMGGALWVRGMLEDTLGSQSGQTAPVALVHNPEFLREGRAIVDFLHPDRVVLGSDDAHALRLVTELYQPILQQSFKGADPTRRPGLMCTDLTTAEMVKYASNAFLATKISFINEIANVCDLVGADVTDVATGMGFDHRIAGEFLSAGLGWGGSCFGKDLSALITTARRQGHEPALLAATVQVNRRQQEVVLHKLALHFASLAGRHIGLLGLAFKPDTDDLRDSPALELAQRLITLGAKVIAYDPLVSRVSCVPGLGVAGDPYEVADGSDALVLATECPDFLLLDLAELRTRMRGNVFIDGRNVFDHHVMEAAGLHYEAVGRSKVNGARPPSSLPPATSSASVDDNDACTAGEAFTQL